MDAFRLFLHRLGHLNIRFSGSVVVTFILLSISGVYAASHLVIDADRIEIFHPSEAIYKADELINMHMDGTNALDIVIETSEIEGLFQPENLLKIELLQDFAKSLPHVMGSVSIADYLKQMNRALNGGTEDMYRLPDSRDLVAQYFLIYSATSDPSDFEEEVDYD